MSYLLNSSLFVCVVIIGLAHGAWWDDKLKNGGNPFGRSKKPILTQRSEDDCKCVLEFQCDQETGLIITDGMGIGQWRSAQKCPSDQVCCLLPEDEIDSDAEPSKKPPASDNTPATSPPTTDIMSEHDYDEFAPDPDPITGVEGHSEPTSVSTGFDTGSGSTTSSSSFFICGVPTRRNVDFKVSGDNDATETLPGNFPWTLVLKYQLSGFGTNGDSTQALLCGASLILSSVAITAAHCLDKKEAENIIVRAGEWDLATDDDDGPFPQERRVKKIVIHPNYDLFTIKNDIAILYLDKPFESSSTVNTICMPTSGEKIKWKTCYATGWGAKGNDQLPDGDQTMKKALLPLVPRKECENKLRSTKLGGRFKLHKSFICAGGESDVDTCKGDGGGPLACQSNTAPHNFHLIGITSWGVGCANKDIPGVYTDVTEMSDWVATEVKKAIESFEIPSL